MPGEMIAYCGLDCTNCSVRLATQRGDMEMLGAIARFITAKWGWEATAESVMCEGLTGEGLTGEGLIYEALIDEGVEGNGRLMDCCPQCAVRACDHCGDYGCRVLHNYAPAAEPMEASLEKI
jgi:hypothetical protein